MHAHTHSAPRRVLVFIDGMNLYYGLRNAYAGRYKWLDLHTLCKGLLRKDEVLEGVKFFTTRLRTENHEENDHIRRQEAYLEALGTTPVQIIYGRMQLDDTTCRVCGNRWESNHEKQTDVNLALTLFDDAMTDAYDTAILISGDSDYLPLFKKLRQRFPRKRLVLAFPPNRTSPTLEDHADAAFTLSEHALGQAQFPERVLLERGGWVDRPEYWH